MKIRIFLLVAGIFCTITTGLFAQGTAFTYQGRLNDGANPANGSYDLTFMLYPASNGGIATAGPLNNSAIAVSNGLFIVTLDFGASAFTGQTRWLEIGVRTNGGGVFNTLAPRQQATPTPYAIYAESASASALSGTIRTSNLGGSYNNALTLTNANNSFGGNGAGLSGFADFRLFLGTNGSAGIGTATPVSALQVIGTVTATSFNPPSDRNLKENFTPVSAREVLDKVSAMPITRWNFIGDPATPHVGPMAQDFHAAFGLGTDDKHIATVDVDGVALAAIPGLNQKLEQKETEIAELKQRLESLEKIIHNQK